MSALFAVDAYLDDTTHPIPIGSGATAFTEMIWVQMASEPTSGEGGDKILIHYSSGSRLGIQDSTDDSLTVLYPTSNTAYSTADFSSAPTFTHWVCYACTLNGDGDCSWAWQDNAGGGWTTQSEDISSAFVNTNDEMIGPANVGATCAYYKAWTVTLTTTQLNAEFLSPTPVVTADLWRYLPIADAASAGTDMSGNGYNVGTSGTITNGASEPTFPSAAAPAQPSVIVPISLTRGPSQGSRRPIIDALPLLPLVPLRWIIERRRKLMRRT